MAKKRKTSATKTVLLDGDNLSLTQVDAIAEGIELEFSHTTKKRVEAAHVYVMEVAKQAQPVYGVNTGFGFFSNQKIASQQLQKLQTNLIKSHAAGSGLPLSIPETRVAIALRLHVMLKGYTGVSWKLCEALLALIRAKIYPLIPEYGSVGASGDLIPLAHLALSLMGLGKVNYKGKVVSARRALRDASLRPYKLKAKEGLGLINGTQIMMAVGGLALLEAKKILQKADQIAALTFEGMEGLITPLHPLIHQLRGHQGQIDSADQILKELKGSYLTKKGHHFSRVQDPYSLRCAPQVHGASREAVHYACQVVEKELNAATDNPLVFAEPHLILSGGNFHGQPLALAFDFAAIALSEIANISERRLELLLNPHHSGLPAFLSPREGLCSGYMAAQYLAASLVNENKLLANPASTDSIPGNVGVEDHVSMGMTSARKLKKIVQHVKHVLSIEWMAAAQAIDLRKVKTLGTGTQKSYALLRTRVPKLTEDRIVAEDIHKTVELFHKL